MSYDPVESFRTEVNRFMRTNHFDPMYVTQFYVQGSLTLRELDTLRKQREKDAETIEKLREALKQYSSREVRDRKNWMDNCPLYRWSLHRGHGWVYYDVPDGEHPWDAADKALWG